MTRSLQVAPASPSLVVRRAERELVLGLQVSFCRFCFFSFVCLFVLFPEFCLFVFNLIFVLSGDKGDPRTRVWWKGAICEFTLRNPCLIWNSEFIFGYNVNCFHRGVPNFISANSLEIRLFEFDGPTQSLLQLQGRKVQNICPLFLIFILCVFLYHTPSD